MADDQHHQATLLIVEDDEPLAELLEVLLGGIAGWATIAVPDACTAQQIVAQQPVDLVLLDVNLPDRSGLELLSDLQADPQWQHQPVIVLSAEADQPDVQAAVHAGQATCCIAKPFDLGNVVDEVQLALDAVDDMVVEIAKP
jgi:DNA-binding response OmpR family regulator